MPDWALDKHTAWPRSAAAARAAAANDAGRPVPRRPRRAGSEPERVDLDVLRSSPSSQSQRGAVLEGSGMRSPRPVCGRDARRRRPRTRVARGADRRDTGQDRGGSTTAFEAVLDAPLRDGLSATALSTRDCARAAVATPVIRETRLGLDVDTSGEREANVETFAARAGLRRRPQGARASKGIIFSASTFSSDARAYADSVSPRVILVDGEHLAALMIDHDVGVSARETYLGQAR